MKQEDKSSYFIQSNPIELGRLEQQSRVVTQGKPLAEQNMEIIRGLHDVLDLACGPGEWAITLGEQYPHMNISGIDINPQMVDYANQKAKGKNIQFIVGNIHNIEELYPESSFDLINARFLGGLMPRNMWLPLIETCRRLLRPGGLLRLTECEASVTNSDAQNEMGDIITQALYRSGLGFNKKGPLGIVNQLPNFLRTGGFKNVQIHAEAIDISNGQPDAEAIQQDFIISLNLLRPFLLKYGSFSTSEEIDTMLDEILNNWMNTNYLGIWFFLTCWGINP